MKEKSGVASFLIAAIGFMQKNEIANLEDATRCLAASSSIQTHNLTAKQRKEPLAASERVKRAAQEN